MKVQMSRGPVPTTALRRPHIHRYIAAYHPETDELAGWHDCTRLGQFLRTAVLPSIVNIGCAYGVQAVLVPGWPYLSIAYEEPLG
jgi:hypothetical protein